MLFFSFISLHTTCDDTSTLCARKHYYLPASRYDQYACSHLGGVPIIARKSLQRYLIYSTHQKKRTENTMGKNSTPTNQQKTNSPPPPPYNTTSECVRYFISCLTKKQIRRVWSANSASLVSKFGEFGL